jgi:hypothetical protein
MYLRRWWPQAELLYYGVPVLAAVVLVLQARLPWGVLRVAQASA